MESQEGGDQIGQQEQEVRRRSKGKKSAGGLNPYKTSKEKNKKM